MENNAVNAALLLRRPLLVTGRPGVGKSSLAYRVSRELRLGRVLRWAITSQSTLTEALYSHDSIARVYDAALARPGLPGAATASGQPEPNIGDYIRLGPLGTALLPYAEPRVLLIDEFDKSDIDLPNDLLNVLEEGEYRIAELERIASLHSEVELHTDDPGVTAQIIDGRIRCRAFPFIVITSNGERDFSPAFMRRCLHLSLEQPDESQLAEMVIAHFSDRSDRETGALVEEFLRHREVNSGLAADQLLNAAYLTMSGAVAPDASWDQILDLLWRTLQPRAAVE